MGEGEALFMEAGAEGVAVCEALFSDVLVEGGDSFIIEAFVAVFLLSSGMPSRCPRDPAIHAHSSLMAWSAMFLSEKLPFFRTKNMFMRYFR